MNDIRTSNWRLSKADRRGRLRCSLALAAATIHSERHNHACDHLTGSGRRSLRTYLWFARFKSRDAYVSYHDVMEMLGLSKREIAAMVHKQGSGLRYDPFNGGIRSGRRYRGRGGG